jgi:5-methyltetrahydrofolate--homocysteine methyltransferase
MVSCEKILETARKEKVDIIGLSGLITPSLEEMNYVASEMQRQQFNLPLLIGGATTSRAHTALKIEPYYTGPTVHVVDASRAVGVASQLLSDEHKDGYVVKIREEYETLRELHKGKKSETQLVSLDEARANKIRLDWESHTIIKPRSLGVQAFIDYPLQELIDYIDWTPFFSTWELAGRYPRILEDKIVGESARHLFDDAQSMLKYIVAEKWLKANAVIGFFPANSVGDDIEVYADENREVVIKRFHMLRQQTRKAKDKYNLSLADFVAPKATGVADYIGGFAVSAGLEMDKKVAEFEKSLDDYSAIMLKALGDRLAESFAEHMHYRVRREFWPYAAHEDFTNEELIAEKYQGIRPAPGYPACPDHTEKPALFELLDVTHHTGIRLTENHAMWPASSVSGFYFSHPDSTYFGVGKLGEDQIIDYAQRKQMPVMDVKRWLATHV